MKVSLDILRSCIIPRLSITEQCVAQTIDSQFARIVEDRGDVPQARKFLEEGHHGIGIEWSLILAIRSDNSALIHYFMNLMETLFNVKTQLLTGIFEAAKVGRVKLATDIWKKLYGGNEYDWPYVRKKIIRGLVYGNHIVKLRDFITLIEMHSFTRSSIIQPAIEFGNDQILYEYLKIDQLHGGDIEFAKSQFALGKLIKAGYKMPKY